MSLEDLTGEEDIQKLQVNVPRATILKIAKMKKAMRIRREAVVIEAIESSYKAFTEKANKFSKGKDYNNSVKKG